MGRRGLVWAVCVGFVAACSGGGGTAATTTTTSSTTRTTAPTTTTTSPEDAVKAAYLAYWKMIDRVSMTPDPEDPELPQRMVDPRLSNARDELATERARGRTTRTPPGGKYSHVIQSVTLDKDNATVNDCSVDDQVVYGPDDVVLDSAVTTKHFVASFVRTADTWKVADVRIVRQESGEQSCAA